MESQENTKKSSAGLTWAITLAIVLILIIWLTGGIDAIFGDREESELVPTEETMETTEQEPAPEREPLETATKSKSAAPVAVDVEGTDYYMNTEVPPAIVGGIEALSKKIKYPEAAKNAGVEGRVLIKAYLDEKGNVVHTEVQKGIGMGCDEAARKAVMDTRFTPGQIGVKTVKSIVTVPVSFKLNNRDDETLDLESIPPGTPGMGF